MTGSGPGPLDVALDVTPLIGARSGVGHFVAEILDAMVGSPGIRLVPYALSLRARRGVGMPGLWRPAAGPSSLPPGTRQLPLPAGAAIAAWGRIDQPSAERWLAPATVVHGTNFVVPPMRGAGAVVTVHADQPGRPISPNLFGIFFEDLNYAADGHDLAPNRATRRYAAGDVPAVLPKAW